LLADNQVVGTIAVSRRRDEPFQESELATLRDLGGLVVLALRNTVLLGEAQKAANRLGTSEERFRLLVESVKDYAIFLLDPAGHVSSWNQGAERIKGYTTAEIVGRHFSTFYSTEDILAGRPARGLATAEREGRYEDEGWRLRKDGTRFWASVVITALRDETGRLRGFAKVTRDLTERKRIEDQLLEAERREAAKFHELAERMAGLERMKSEFLNLASHELRTPVSLIRGYLSLFEEGDLGELNERGRRALTVLRAQARDLNSLIEQMLEAAHLHDGGVNLYPEPLDLGRVASDGVAAVRDVSQGKPRIVLLAPEEPVPVVGDLRRLRTIVESLLDNAVKYSPNREEIICMVSAASDRAYFKIEDRGLGLDQEQLDQLFSSFGRIVTNHKADISGAGLGLYLARELARLHGGDVSAESDPGQGSVYTLSLPLAARRDETPLLAGDDAQGAAIPSTSGAG
jgi:PAS domain S-box-containing protein